MILHFNRIAYLIVAALCLARGAFADSIFNVDADQNSITDYYADSQVVPNYHAYLVDTGIFLNIGDILSIDATGIWRISPSDPWTDANGQIGRDSGGFFVGSLLGQISSDGPHITTPGNPQPMFFIGSNYLETVTQSGYLYLGFNDTDYGNNEGFVAATVNVIPFSAPVSEPTTIVLVCLGFAGILLRRKLIPQ